MPYCFDPIGVVHSTYHQTAGMPIQPTVKSSAPGTVEIFPEYIPGLKDLDGFSHIMLIYVFHQAGNASLHVKPFLDSELRGVFATRAPSRPNPIGISIVELLKVDVGTLFIANLDILDGTPLLDIKPFVPDFDGHPEARIGWLQASRGQIPSTRADDRF